MRGTFDGEPTDYRRGFMAGVLAAATGVVTYRAIEWALANPIAESVVAWATTPAITPLDVATAFVGLFALYLVLVATVNLAIGRKA